MEKQQSSRNMAMEKQKTFRIAMERQMKLGNLGKVKEFIQTLESVKNSMRDLVLKQKQEGETPLYVAAENGFG